MQETVHVLLFSFGSYTLTAKGYNLRPLFNALLEYSPKIITVINPRYMTHHDPQNSVVTKLVAKSD